jgi:hypothetical protein
MKKWIPFTLASSLIFAAPSGFTAERGFFIQTALSQTKTSYEVDLGWFGSYSTEREDSGFNLELGSTNILGLKGFFNTVWFDFGGIANLYGLNFGYNYQFHNDKVGIYASGGITNMSGSGMGIGSNYRIGASYQFAQRWHAVADYGSLFNDGDYDVNGIRMGVKFQ